MIRLPIKICCIQNVEEANRAVSYGVDALGFVSAMPSGFGPIPESLISEIIATVPARVATVLLTSQDDPDRIIEQARRCKPSALQLCAPLKEDAPRRLRKALPHVKLVQVVHVTGPEAIRGAERAASASDALLLDTGVLSGPMLELGGTGRTHDWSVSRTIVEQVRVPVWLAGGLNAQNVARAVRMVAPYGVDVCTGVRTHGILDPDRLKDFVGALEPFRKS